MKCFGILSVFGILLPLSVRSSWCETSNRTGCRGQSRHFVRETSAANPFLAFRDIKVAYTEDPIVVDWDNDGDLDVILRTTRELRFFEFKSGNHFVQIEPSPFEGIYSDLCRPAVVDWNEDGRLDLIVGTEDGIKYYERHSDGKLHEKADNPFKHIDTTARHCTDLAVADWDGDGNWDLLVSDASGLSLPMRHFEQSNGRLELVDMSSGPFQSVMTRTRIMRPLLEDWDGDGRIDLVLMAKVPERSLDNWKNLDLCRVEIHLQLADGTASARDTADFVLRNLVCQSFKGSGVSLVDVDKDGDKDAIFGAFEGPLHVYERVSSECSGYWFCTELKLPTVTSGSESIPLDMIQLETTINLQNVVKLNLWLHPVLVDWDLDGDLDFALIDSTPQEDLASSDRPKPRYFEHQPNDTVIELSGPPNVSCPIDWNLFFSFVDFDGDGKKDLVGFDTEDQGGGVYGVNICIQTSSGFQLIEADQNPFRRLSCSFCPWDNDQVPWDFGDYFNWDGYPSFLDWDEDGDLDMLRITTAQQVYLYEQLSNGTFFPQPLPVPNARDYTAADFDGDGDVDIIVTTPSGGSCLYFERRSDGSLDQLFGTDNPFHDVAQVTGGDTISIGINNWLSTLGDWNGDGEMDIILVEDAKVSLWINRPFENFVEVVGKEQPFRQIALAKKTAVSMVDVNNDGKLDIVFPPQVPVLTLANRHETYRYFQQQTTGMLKEQQGSDNPFDTVKFDNVKGTAVWALPLHLVKNLVVDFDADGDLDIVHEQLYYSQNDNGKFKLLEPADPSNPFHGIDDTMFSFWTLVDVDGDGNWDLVQAYRPSLTLEILDNANTVVKEMKQNGTSQKTINAWLEQNVGVRMRFYRQVRSLGNSSFLEVTGADSPFHDIGFLGLNSLCPAMVDLNADGDLDLVLGTTDGNLLYYEQHEGRFQRAASNPFADLSIDPADGYPVQPRFADFDGDGSLDLVLTGTDKLQFFQRGGCLPSSSYCRSGSCDKQSRQCNCFPGAQGEDCSLCGDYHVREHGVCRACPGYGKVSSACNRRGTCHDDADARASRMASNHSGFKVTEARGTGTCKCSPPFTGAGCEKGSCPPGQRLDLDAPVKNVSEKYPKWQACVPCQSGRFKNFSGNTECRSCPPGQIPEDGSRCIPCGAGTVPWAKNRSRCEPCDVGYVAVAGNPTCTPCEAGTAPNEDRSVCVKCQAGAFARSRSPQCSMCPLGTVPGTSKSGCIECTGQFYALEGDEVCQPCTFPAMILNDDNWCTSLYTVLFILGFLLFMVLVLAVFGRLRLECLKRRLNKLVATESWQELHSTRTTLLKYGLWKHKAGRVVEDRKLQVKKASFQLGISLQYVFEHLENVYKEKAEQAEWRLDEWGPVTKSGFFVKVRNCKLQVDPLAAWNALPRCDYPKDPNFHQVAGVLAYGPWALGKHQCCPRDGLRDCSIVDALRVESNSAKATWFLSWVWGYHFTTVYKALTRWWKRHKIVSSAGEDAFGQGVYIWWCVFVNNQFRMLEAGQVEEPGDLFNVFGQQLDGIGKMLMCLDKMKGSQYTTRIWCIFEVFVACQRSIPTTVILPDLEVSDEIKNLKDLTQQCRVDAEKAKASVEADAEAIKEHIQEKHQSFEYVNQTVEQALWCEVIKFLEQKDQTSTEPSQTQSEEQTDSGMTQSIVSSGTDSD